ncbi:MAG: TOMM precursor leader peptide-binding protein [Streptosporangiaceae bacterium]|nr:TOMM precursor leader peptide-binding protein [Streptosporangiaceae bacterium]MBV9855053.1 TOMM precursor leader peptide-binding protein [Streptosporangiaceae bacterium]
MAAAVHVTVAEPVSVVPVGPFGAAVAELVRSSGRAVTVVADGDVHRAFREPAGLVVMVSWRPCPSLCAGADDLAFALGRPWLPVLRNREVIAAGPLVSPPDGPCYRCYTRRALQHDRRFDETETLNAAFDSGQAFGPAGFLPQEARVAAGLIAAIIATNAAVTAARTTFSLVDRSVKVHDVIPCPDCDRCLAGQDRLRKSRQDFSEMIAARRGPGA